MRVAEYADLPEGMSPVVAADGKSGVDLGNGTIIALGRDEYALASALTRYLETMRSAARTGEVPEGVIDADLASRAARALPDVARVTAKGRSFGQDLSQFRSALQSATPRAVMSPIFIGACVLVYAAMVATGVPWMFPSTAELSRLGRKPGHQRRAQSRVLAALHQRVSAWWFHPSCHEYVEHSRDRAAG